MHRTIYPILFIISILFAPMMSSSKGKFFQNSVFAIIIAFAINALGETYFPLLFDENTSSMYQETMEMGSNNIVIKTVLFFTGPLWRQIYTAPEYSFVLAETFVIVLLDASLLAFIACRSDFKFSKINSLAVFGFLLLCVGAFNSSAHVPYIAVGVIFMLPFVVDVCTAKVLTKKIRIISMALVALNVFSLFFGFGVF